MKNLFFILFGFLGHFCQAQIEILTAETWKLENLEMNENIYLPPINDEVSIITASFINDNIYTSICNGLLATIVHIDSQNSFTIIEDPLTLVDCELQENTDFESLYFFQFFYEDGVLMNPFSYYIEEDQNILYLILNNSLGNTATYSATTLSSSNFEASDFSIYPNPVTHQLYIKSQQPIHQVEVFNLSGKRILNEAYQENQAIDVSSLPSGMYILKIETENGSITKKLVKE